MKINTAIVLPWKHLQMNWEDPSCLRIIIGPGSMAGLLTLSEGDS